ncbi:hypothetical protein BC826DRAFT_470848 [Russula brevipes]|nr:hypothetical protein BC826DRAFT_470848 [Russula brevipes]
MMRSNRHSLTSYLSLVAHALTTLKALTERASSRPRPHVPVCLVLMDSRLDSLNFPVLKPPSMCDGPESRRTERPSLSCGVPDTPLL